MIYCCACKKEIEPKLTRGYEIYPHREDLYELYFWECENCHNYVGCHKGTQTPLGNIPTPEIRNARKEIHKLMDPLWKSGKRSRKGIYMLLSEELGKEYHTGEIKSIEEARKVYRIIKEL